MTGLREVEIQAFVLFRTTHLPAEPLTVPWTCAIAHLLPHHLEVPKPLPLPIIRAKRGQPEVFSILWNYLLSAMQE